VISLSLTTLFAVPLVLVGLLQQPQQGNQLRSTPGNRFQVCKPERERERERESHLSLGLSAGFLTWGM